MKYEVIEDCYFPAYVYSPELTVFYNKMFGDLLEKVYVEMWGFHSDDIALDMYDDKDRDREYQKYKLDNSRRKKVLKFKNGAMVELQFSDFGGFEKIEMRKN